MKKHSKCRIALSLLMAAAALTLSFPASYAADTATAAAKSDSAKEEQSMKKALQLVKSRLSIPDEYSEFTYSVSQSRKVDAFRFIWRVPGDSANKKGSYQATVNGGLITQFSAPVDYSDAGYSFSELSAEQAEKLAMDAAEKLNPEMKGHIRVKGPGKTQLSLHSKGITVYFERINDGIEVKKNHASVTIDKITGELLGFSCSWWENAQFTAASKALSEEDIERIYSEEITLKPWYRLIYDCNTEKYTTAIVYEPTSSPVYDAVSGKHTTIDKDYAQLLNTDNYIAETTEDAAAEEDMAIAEPAMNDAMAGDGGVLLTEEEKAALEEMEGLLTADEFKKLMIDDPYIKVTNKYLVDSFDISPDSSFESGYSLSCSLIINNKDEYCSYYITADARSGKVSSFSRSGDSSKTALNVSRANALAKEAANYYYSDIFSSYKASPNNTSPAVKTSDYTERARTMIYNRYENGIEVSSNSISIRVNSDGIVTNLYANHTYDVDFGDGKIISPETALDRLFDNQKMTLEYNGFTDLASKPHTYLHYRMDSWYINAKTGALCNYNGTPLSESKDIPDCPYTDIEKSPYKDEIIRLYEHGVYITADSRLEPDKAITAGELSSLLSKIGGIAVPIPYTYSGYEEPVYEDVIYEENIISEKDSNAKVKRRELAQHFTAMIGADNIALYKGIFKTPFKDVSASDKDIGYIAIAYGMGAIKPDARYSSGKFLPDEYVTREYALACVYNYIENN